MALFYTKGGREMVTLVLRKYTAQATKDGLIYQDKSHPKGLELRKIIVLAPTWEHAYQYIQSKWYAVLVQLWGAEKASKKAPVFCTHPWGVVVRTPEVQEARTGDVDVRRILGLRQPQAA